MDGVFIKLTSKNHNKYVTEAADSKAIWTKKNKK